MGNESRLSAMDLSPLPITHEATIPVEYLDDMGHMNVMWYTHLFDAAVYTLFGIIGLDSDYMKANNAGGFALETHVRYLSEVRVDHHVTVRTRLLGRSQKRFHLMNFMTNTTKGDLAARCQRWCSYWHLRSDFSIQRRQRAARPAPFVASHY